MLREAVVISLIHDGSSQSTSLWKGPGPNPWISKWHYVRAAMNHTGQETQTAGKLAILLHRLKCVVSQKKNSLERICQFNQ